MRKLPIFFLVTTSLLVVIGYMLWHLPSQGLTSEDYRIYSALFNQWNRVIPEPPTDPQESETVTSMSLHIPTHTIQFSVTLSNMKMAPLHPDKIIVNVDGLQPSTWKSFFDRNNSHSLDQSKLTLHNHIELSPENSFSVTAHLSQIGYSKDGNQALVFVEQLVGGMGTGQWVILHRRNKQWLVVSTKTQWV